MIPAAQYIRMSTENQQYSLYNQTLAIAEYARKRDFTIVQTYSDAARSGLTLNRRYGLRQLLSDVIAGSHLYKAVLVYDVSRWGRFQDTDESAHYEFLCRSAGVSVHYIAEPFENDCSFANSVMKNLKRSMAAEFSRELGVRVHNGKKNIVAAGFNVGGRVAFGFQRKIVSDDPGRCRLLEKGERKNVRSERITLVHGPSHEVACVRRIFRSVVEDGMSPREISRDLNRRGITIRGKHWTQKTVHYVLTNPEYAGFCTWARTSQRLGLGRVLVARDQWVLKPDAFAPIVSQEQYDRAQQLLAPDPGRRFWTRDRVLRAAKQLLEKEGKITSNLFDATPGFPRSGTVRRLSLPDICKSLNYQLPERFTKFSNSIRSTFRLRRELLQSFVTCFPNELSISRGGWPKLLLDRRILVSLHICRALPYVMGKSRWRMSPTRHDANIVCLLNPTNSKPHSFFIFPRISSSGWGNKFSEDDIWLTRGRPLERYSELCRLLRCAAQVRGDLPNQTPTQQCSL